MSAEVMSPLAERAITGIFICGVRCSGLCAASSEVGQLGQIVWVKGESDVAN
jgi:hypothetical protein